MGTGQGNGLGASCTTASIVFSRRTEAWRHAPLSHGRSACATGEAWEWCRGPLVRQARQDRQRPVVVAESSQSEQERICSLHVESRRPRRAIDSNRRSSTTTLSPRAATAPRPAWPQRLPDGQSRRELSAPPKHQERRAPSYRGDGCYCDASMNHHTKAQWDPSGNEARGRWRRFFCSSQPSSIASGDGQPSWGAARVTPSAVTSSHSTLPATIAAAKRRAARHDADAVSSQPANSRGPASVSSPARWHVASR